MNRRHLLVIALFAVVVIALGSVFLLGERLVDTTDERETFPGTETSSSSNDEPLHMGLIQIAPYQVNKTGEGVMMTPQIRVKIYDHRKSPEYDNLTFENVTLCMYDENGTNLHEEILGTIKTGPDAEFHENYQTNVTVESVPAYLIVDHPKLREDSAIHNEILVRHPEYEYLLENSSSKWYSAHNNITEDLGDIQDNFEWPRTNETGTCG